MQVDVPLETFKCEFSPLGSDSLALFDGGLKWFTTNVAQIMTICEFQNRVYIDPF